MGFWPFGGGGKKQRAAQSDDKSARSIPKRSNESELMGKLEKAGTDLSVGTGSSKPARLTKPRTVSYDVQTPRSQNEPGALSQSRRNSRNTQLQAEKGIYQQNPTSQSSLGPENFSVVRQPPTLYARKPEQDSAIARRKSSKRKAEDYAREREVRAMSSSPIPIPKRPNSFYNSPLERETRDIPSGGLINRKLNRPTSQISLPASGAIAQVDVAPYQNSWKIGTFAALSPRPTIKYDRQSQARGKQPQKPNPLDNPAIVEEGGDPEMRRIDELADDLDAGGLRELMERDKRRRERKKQQDQARLQRKLQRQKEKEKEEEARKARTEEYVSASASRIRSIESDQKENAVPVPSADQYREKPDNDPFADPPTHSSTIRNPFADEKDDVDVMEDVIPEKDHESEPVLPVRSPLRNLRTDAAKEGLQPSQAALSPPISPAPQPTDRQSMSQASLLNREVTAEIPENVSITGAQSDHSSQKLNSWTAFFRRGTRRRLSSSFQGRSTPSEFSNTSRESFSRKQQQPPQSQPPPIVIPRTYRRVDPATPQRTMSKFREDLPEFPISPPDSRMQSPEADAQPTTNLDDSAVEQGSAVDGTAGGTQPIPVTGKRQSQQDLILSQSLASVDSEASWLSGKPPHRRSGLSQRLKASQSSTARPGAFDEGNEVLASPNSEAFATPSEELAAVAEQWHTGASKQVHLVRQASRAKSREGLLNEFTGSGRKVSATETNTDAGDDEDDDTDEDESPGEPEQAVALGRARSVEYKGHARHVSAGSARILDIRRSSVPSTELLAQQLAVYAEEQEKANTGKEV